MISLETQIYLGEVKAEQLVDGNEVTLLSPAANEYYTVTELSFENRSGFSIPLLDLKVNGHIAGTYDDNAEGELKIVPGNTLKLAAHSQGYFDLKYQIAQSAAVVALTELNTLVGEDVIVSDELVQLGLSMPTSTFLTAYLDPARAYLTVGRWDGNSVTNVYKYNMSTKAQIQSLSASYSGMPNLGGDGYIYSASSNSLKRMKLDDASGFVDFGPTLTNHPQSSYSIFATNQVPSTDGKRCFVHAPQQSNPQYYHFRNPSTGAKIGNDIQLGTANSGFFAGVQNALIHPFYSPSRSKWMIAYSNGATLRIADLPASSVTSQFEAAAQITLPSSTGSIACTGDSILFFEKTTGNILEYDLDLQLKGKFAEGRTDVAGMLGVQKIDCFAGVPTAAQIAARDYAAQPKFSLRVTGIKTA